MGKRATKQETFLDYEGFVDKFKPKKTTDDCYTPSLVYEAVLGWARKEYGIPEDALVLRPFHPGGNYEAEEYPKGCYVVDNPPFSKLSQIVRFYNAVGVRYLLFAPALTCMRLPATKLCAGANVTYANGAEICTGFVTNLEPGTEARAVPELYEAVKEADDRSRKDRKKGTLPKYAYPPEVVMSNDLMKLSRAGVAFSVPCSESLKINKLDLQGGKVLFGGGLLVSERLAAERLAAERLAATKWRLSEREKAMVAMMARRK